MKLHFYALVFNSINKDHTSWQSCVYISGSENYVSKSSIKIARQAAKVEESGVLISASYLGFMTEEEFNA